MEGGGGGGGGGAGQRESSGSLEQIFFKSVMLYNNILIQLPF